ncbi:MAG: poly-gamma-glutamate biosynthesis protein PgsC/CapC [Pseudomonadota bacterium]
MIELTLFPEGALAHSVTTCVFVGVAIVVALNLRFGWVLSGLVVPGYLAPLLFERPATAVAIIIEALATYALVRGLASLGRRFALWPDWFGRDRFFALLLASVACRLLFDGWLFPELGNGLETLTGVRLELTQDLHSFGLIIVCLLANQFWKTGFLGGLAPTAVPILLTYAVVRWVLMPFTNFSVGDIGFIYEDVAASLLASPKTYMILLLAAFLASRLNLRFGWDFNGILIPSLLALQWFQPVSILMSFVEAFVILGLGSALLRAPPVRDSSIEGGRKLLYFFSLSFAYKLVIGWGAIALNADWSATDAFGFGYLLPTLLAIKMHDKRMAFRMTRATLQVSLLSVVLGSATAYGLTVGNRWASAPEYSETPATDVIPKAPAESLDQRFARWETEIFDSSKPDLRTSAPLAELERFRFALRSLADALRDNPFRVTPRHRSAFERAGYRLIDYGSRLVLEPAKTKTAAGSSRARFVLSTHLTGQGLLTLADPLSVADLIPAADRLMRRLQLRALAICGSRSQRDLGRPGSCEHDPRSHYRLFRQAFGKAGVLNLVGDSQRTKPTLAVLDTVPTFFDGQVLQRELPNLVVDLARPSRASSSLRSTDVMHLNIDRASLNRLLYSERGGEGSVTTLRTEEQLDLLSRIQADLSSPPATAMPLSDGRALHFEQRLLMPLFGWIARQRSDQLDAHARLELESLQRNARQYGLAISVGGSSERVDRVFLTTALGASSQIGLVLDLSAAAPDLILLPYASAEPATITTAVRLHESRRAAGILWRRSGSSLVPVDRKRDRLWLLIAQSFLRHHADAPARLVEIRPMRPDALNDPAHPGVITLRRSDQRLLEAVPPDLAATFATLPLKPLVYGQSTRTAGYGNDFSVLSRYLTQTSNKLHLTLWLPPTRWRASAAFGDAQLMVAHLRHLGVDVRSTTAQLPAPRSDDANLTSYWSTLDPGHLSAYLRRRNTPVVAWINEDRPAVYLGTEHELLDQLWPAGSNP